MMIGDEQLLTKKHTDLYGESAVIASGDQYDDWKDPWGRIHEHWADSDLLNTECKATVQAVDSGRDYWGDQQNPPVKYAIQNWKLTTLSDIVRMIARATRAKVSRG